MPDALHYIPLRRGYLPGERLCVALFSPSGTCLGQTQLEIAFRAGSGFAGQVYQATMTGPGAGESGKQVAVKVLLPHSRWKEHLRDGLFWLCFQAPFAPRLREPAVRCGLILQEVLSACVSVEFANLPPDLHNSEEALTGQPAQQTAIVSPLGYFWDEQQGSYVEIHEWIDNRPTLYETDEQLIERWRRHVAAQPATEMAQKKDFMDRLAGLCRAIGAIGLSRQYEWYTLVSQANVVTRTGTEEATFTAVDCRPGLAFPFFLPFTPVHARMALEGARKGRLVHYDEVDFTQLEHWLDRQPALRACLGDHLVRLRADDAAYRSALPDLWHTLPKFLSDSAFRRVRLAAIQSAQVLDWNRLQICTPQSATWLKAHPAAFVLLSMLFWVPLLGPFLVRLLLHPPYRSHLAALITRKSYQKRWLEAFRSRDLQTWPADGRISAQRRDWLKAAHPLAYMIDKLFFSWLPVAAHRFLTDPSARLLWLQQSFVHPISLLVNHSARIALVDEIIRQHYQNGSIDAARAAILKEQIREQRMQSLIRGLGFTAGLDIFSRLIYLLLGVYAFRTGNFIPLGVAILGPVPPSGVIRGLYALAQLIIYLPNLPHVRKDPFVQRLLITHALSVVIAPWRWIGNLFPILQISIFYPRLALLLAETFAERAANHIPVFGGQGKLLEYGLFLLCYNLPVAIKYSLAIRR